MKLSTGYLNKLSAGDTGTRHPRWKRRWFAFDSNLKMVYWHSEEVHRTRTRRTHRTHRTRTWHTLMEMRW
jgi:hypothetical protein